MRKVFLVLFFFAAFISYFLFLPEVTTAAEDTACTIQKECDGAKGDADCQQYNKPTCGAYFCTTRSGKGRCAEGVFNPTAPLIAPVLKISGATTNSISLQWTRVPGAKTYQIYDDSGSGKEIKTVSSTKDGFMSVTMDKLSQKDTAYAFTVAACRDKECSEQSNRVVSETLTTDGKKNLGEPCNPTFTGEGQCSRGSCVPIAASLLGVGIVDPALLAGNVGRCVDLVGGSSTADISKVVPSIEKTGVTGNSVNLTVKTNPPNGNKDIDIWNVYYRKEGSQSFQQKTFKEDNFTLSGLTPNTVYHVHVLGLNLKGNSPNSNELVFTTSETQKDIAKSCTAWDCGGTVCSRFNGSGGPVCLISSQKGQPLACSCGEAPPPPEPPCTKFDERGLCESLNTAIGNLQTSPTGIAKTVFGIILSLSGGLAVILIMTAGYQIMTSEGNPEKIQAAKDTITSTVIGLVFMMFSLVLLQIIGVDILHIPGLKP